MEGILRKNSNYFMKIGIQALIVLSFFIVLSCRDNSKKDQLLKTDICILGGSEAGFTAAVQAARSGKKVILIEPSGHPGGMMVEGIVKDIRFGSARVIGGIAREVYTAIEAYYGLEPEFENPDWYSKYEPSVAEKIIEDLLSQEDNIKIIRKIRVKENDGVVKKGQVIKHIVLENGNLISAKMYIDASIEGHLLQLAGITTETIREGNDKYDETKNGIQHDNSYRQFEVDVDPYLIPGNHESGLIPTIQDGDLGEFGTADKYIQGYCFRMCLTKDKGNWILIEKSEDYDPATYEIYRRYLKAGGKLFQPRANRHNGKTDIGSWHDLSANLYGENWQYPEGDYAMQDSIEEYHKNFTIGLVWFLQNDPDVDSLTRKNWEGWGLCRDEFKDNDHWPRRLYIRSARRMVSDYVITEHQTSRENDEEVVDPVAIAWWPPDTHHARRIVKDGLVYNEGFVFGGDDWKPFGISWRSLIPKSIECANLLTPTCVSSSYVAYGAIRILPTFMILGQSAGLAASMAIDMETMIQEIQYSDLKTGLIESGQILDIPDNWLEVIMTNN